MLVTLGKAGIKTLDDLADLATAKAQAQAEKVVNLLAQNGLKRGENGLCLIMMCEVPSNALLADEFLDIFDGFSIGSNDLTQLSLALPPGSRLDDTLALAEQARQRMEEHRAAELRLAELRRRNEVLGEIEW